MGWKDRIQVESESPKKTSWRDRIQEEPINESTEDSGNLLSSTKETAYDAATAAGQGLSLGFSDEIVGALGALAEKARGEDRPLGELYKEWRDIERKRIEESAQRSPTASLAGEIAGGLTGAVATGGASLLGSLGRTGVKEALKTGGKTAAAKALAGKVARTGIEGTVGGAAYGAGQAEEMGDIPSEVLEGAKTGALFGTGLGVANELVPAVVRGIRSKVGKIGEDIIGTPKESPFLGRMKVARELSEEGITPSSRQSNYEQIIAKKSKETDKLTDTILKLDNEFGKEIGDSLTKATDRGVRVKIDQELFDAKNSLLNVLENDPILSRDPSFKKLSKEIFDTLSTDSLTPNVASILRDKMINIRDKFSNNPYLYDVADTFQKSLRKNMVEQIPELDNALNQFSTFRTIVPETLSSKGKTFTSKWLGEASDKGAVVEKGIDDIINKLRDTGVSREVGTETLLKLKDNLKNHPEILEKLGFKTADEFADVLIKVSDLSGVVKALSKRPLDSLTFFDTIKDLVLLGRTAEERLYQAQNIYTKFKKGVTQVASKTTQPVANLSRRIYQETDDSLRQISNRLQQTPGLKKLGDNLLDSLNNKNEASKRAALFVIMQNPEARNLLNDVNEE
jgi:hypothetical protein